MLAEGAIWDFYTFQASRRNAQPSVYQRRLYQKRTLVQQVSQLQDIVA